MEANTEKAPEGVEVREAPPIPKGMIVMHNGLNRAERHKHIRAMKYLPNGHREKNRSRFMLKNTPKNFPIRRVILNGQATLVFEPQFTEIIKVFSDQWRERYTADVRAMFPADFDLQQSVIDKEFDRLRFQAFRHRNRKNIPSFTFLQSNEAEAAEKPVTSDDILGTEIKND